MCITSTGPFSTFKTGLWFLFDHLFEVDTVFRAARLSILFTILRICPSPRMSTQIKCCAVLFAAGLAINIGLMIGTCHADESWARKSGLCPLHHSIPYVQMSSECLFLSLLAYQTFALFTAGIAADALLVYIPIRILRDLTSSPTLRRRLQIIFSITILLTAACIAQSIFVIKSPGLKVLIASSAEVSRLSLYNFQLSSHQTAGLYRDHALQLDYHRHSRHSSFQAQRGG
jgi:hypothetical protein